MVKIKVKEEKLIDFSFMPSLKCNLSCGHCMYGASPSNREILNFEKAKKFIDM